MQAQRPEAECRDLAGSDNILINDDHHLLTPQILRLHQQILQAH